jgi:PKD repeat protein
MKMHTLNYLRRTAALGVLGLATIGVVACGVDSNEMPALSGPSGFGRSVVMTASPDQLPRDATSASTVTLELRDAGGLRIGGQIVTLGVSPGASLSQSQVTTGPDGKATFAVVAPNSTAIMPNNTVVVTAVPVGGNSDNAISGSLSIGLLGASNSTAPTAAFLVTPAAPELNQLATFDASTSTDEGSKCLDVCTYQWDFDDSTTAVGRVVTHSFSVARSYNVALTVTDSVGLTDTLRQFVTPTAPAAPTVTLAVAPNPPVVNQLATFTATGTPAAKHSIVRYEWNFGDGSTTTSFGGSISHTYSAPGIFSVTIRVIDDLGQVGSNSLQLNLTTGVPTGINASFFFSPTDPVIGQTVIFDAKGSTASNGATITDYRWDWGDGASEDNGTTSTASHSFGSANTFVVKLTITDSQGRVSTTSMSVPVKKPT